MHGLALVRYLADVPSMGKRFLGLLAFVVACHHDCITVPGCLSLPAIKLTVTSAATHAPLSGVTVVVNGDTLNPIQCNGQCAVLGNAGVYTLVLKATGFQSIERTVTVTAGPPTYSSVYGPSGFEGRSCGCATVSEQSISIALSPGS
jgi:hypothetical protein